MNIPELEEIYLKAKIAYYTGESKLSDSEFDEIEKILEEAGSKVIEQVGFKRKDFDFPQPTPMLSLSKIQTEKIDDEIDYKIYEFKDWFNKKSNLVHSKPDNAFKRIMISSPKFDGNGINIIYRNGILSSTLTRGDGTAGKDITERIRPLVSESVTGKFGDIYDLVEIRAEIVLSKKIFNTKYKDQFANPRNYVAGLLSSDDWDNEKLSELTIIPVHYLINHEQVNPETIKEYSHSWFQQFDIEDYESVIKHYEKLREEIDYPLDGVVLSFDYPFRKELGENSHDPEWSVAIKFIPEEVVTTVKKIEWNVSKNGELAPVALVEPKFFDGSTVSRVSVYNLGFIIEKGIGPNAVVSIAKSGDIIPEVQRIIIRTDEKETDLIPTECPFCHSDVTVEDIHAYCSNDDCPGKKAKQLAHQIKVLNIKRIGEKTMEPFGSDFNDIVELFDWVYTKGNTSEIEKYGIKHNSRSQEIFVNAFKNIKSIPFEKVIQVLGIENVGNKITVQLSKEMNGLDYDYGHLEKALVSKMRSESMRSLIAYKVKTLENLGITIDRPKQIKKDAGAYGVCLTGSPKAAGYKTKKEFLEKFNNMFETSLSDSECKYLITDNLGSTSSKMKKAQKKGIIIKTYSDF